MVMLVQDKKLKLFFYYAIVIIYLEFIFKIFAFKKVFNIGSFYTFLFTISIALFLQLISNFFGSKFNKILTYVITVTLIILFAFHYIHHKLFSTIFSFYSIGLADQAWDFRGVVLSQIINSWLQLILMFIPLILLIIFRKKLQFHASKPKQKVLIAILTLISYFNVMGLFISSYICYRTSIKL